jgi:hypothetical protein
VEARLAPVQSVLFIAVVNRIALNARSTFTIAVIVWHFEKHILLATQTTGVGMGAPLFGVLLNLLQLHFQAFLKLGLEVSGTPMHIRRHGVV